MEYSGYNVVQSSALPLIFNKAITPRILYLKMNFKNKHIFQLIHFKDEQSKMQKAEL